MSARREAVIAVGMTGSGKTQVIARHFGPRHPRRITFDVTGETARLYPAARQVYGVAAAAAELSRLYRRRSSQWHICVSTDAAGAASLLSSLCPLHDGRSVSLSAAFGGVAVECFELDAFAPVSAPLLARPWRTAFLRGRHVGLSLLCATQFPALVDRAATSQAGTVVAFALHEPAHLRYLRDLVGRGIAERCPLLPEHHSLWLQRSPWRVEHRNARYRVLRAWNRPGDFVNGES